MRLLKKKEAELNHGNNPWSSQITLFQVGFGIRTHLMPSTGNVKVLVLPIEFNDEKLGDSIEDKLRGVYFSEQDLTNEELQYKDLSLCDYYKKVSFNKLKLSGMILPVYSASENRDYYKGRDENNKWRLAKEIVKAVDLNRDIIGDLSEYDSDGDGYIDCLHVIWAGLSGNWGTAWWSQVYSESIIELYDGIKVDAFVGCPESHINTHTTAHETAHLMGLPDNYDLADPACVLPDKVHDLMCSGYYINAFYKYLLDWEEPEILPYEDKTNEIELYASDIYSENTINKKRTIIFAPDPTQLPFGEFYIMEYRAQEMKYAVHTFYPGMIIWHCNSKKTSYGNISIDTEYIEPVYKSNDESSYEYEDLYYVEDEWTSETSPSSDFYDDVYTGAYMKVMSMDRDKASIRAGFVNPAVIPSPAPVDNERPVITVIGDKEMTLQYGEEYIEQGAIVTDNADADIQSKLIIRVNKFSVGVVEKVDTNSPGIYYVFYEAKDEAGNLAYSQSRMVTVLEASPTPTTIPTPSPTPTMSPSPSPSPTPSPIPTPTPMPRPVITIIGDNEITLMRGEEYIELGAIVTYDADADIQSRLTIRFHKLESGAVEKVDTDSPGTYYVWYEAKAASGISAYSKRRTVIVLAASPSPTPTATPSPSPTPTATPNPTPSPTPTPSPSPTPTPSPTSTATPNLTPSPTPTPTVSPSSTASPSPTPTPTASPRDRMEFTYISDNLVLSQLRFEKTVPPDQDDICVYAAFMKDGRLMRIQTLKVTGMSMLIDIPDMFKDCNISVYVWDKDMKPLMEVQKII